MRQAKNINQKNWEQILDDCERSGQTVREFCKNRSISISAYYYWKKKIFGFKSDTTPSIVELTGPWQTKNDRSGNESEIITLSINNDFKCRIELDLKKIRLAIDRALGTNL